MDGQLRTCVHSTSGTKELPNSGCGASTTSASTDHTASCSNYERCATLAEVKCSEAGILAVPVTLHFRSTKGGERRSINEVNCYCKFVRSGWHLCCSGRNYVYSQSWLLGNWQKDFPYWRRTRISWSHHHQSARRPKRLGQADSDTVCRKRLLVWRSNGSSEPCHPALPRPRRYQGTLLTGMPSPTAAHRSHLLARSMRPDSNSGGSNFPFSRSTCRQAR